MVTNIVAFGGALGLSTVLTHRVRAWANDVGLVDRPDGKRHVHDRPIPRVGGVAIFFSVVTVAVVALVLPGGPVGIPPDLRLQFYAILVGGAIIFALGFRDDIGPLAARTKFVAEALVAAAMFAAGVRIDGLVLPSGELVELPLIVALPLTIVWIVGLTNAFNLIDGADGVAGGAAIFASIAIAAVSIVAGNDLGAALALIVAGATLGFLFFNFPPATIFLGDCGSLFLGFILASLGVLTAQTASTALAVAIPVVSCGLPILDTLLAMMRRFLRGEPIFNPDRGHIHHRLRDLGHSPRKVAMLLYAACAGFALLSLVLVQPAGPATAVILSVAGVVVWIAVQRLHIPELLEVQRIVGRGLQQRAVIGNNVRIREAAARLRRVVRPEDVRTALREAFEGGDFDRVDFRIHHPGAPYLAGASLVRGADGAWRWVWGGNDRGPVGYWELRLPFHDAAGDVVGRLSLWRAPSGALILTDLRIIAEELQPELLRALDRLMARTGGHAGPRSRTGELVGA